MSRDLNLNASRAARAERGEVAPTVTLGEATFTLPIGLPMVAVTGFADALTAMSKSQEAAADGDDEVKAPDLSGFTSALRSLFGARYQEALDLGLELEDLEAIFDLYNTPDATPGEAPAPAAS